MISTNMHVYLYMHSNHIPNNNQYYIYIVWYMTVSQGAPTPDVQTIDRQVADLDVNYSAPLA